MQKYVAIFLKRFWCGRETPTAEEPCNKEPTLRGQDEGRDSAGTFPNLVWVVYASACSAGSILGKATSTTDYWSTVKQTNKQTNWVVLPHQMSVGGSPNIYRNRDLQGRPCCGPAQRGKKNNPLLGCARFLQN